MRVDDRPVPVLTPHPLPPESPMYRWPARLRIGLERLPTAAYVWDDEDPDVTWDDTTPERVWDAPFIGGGFTDAVCDFHTVDLEIGDPDELGLFGAAHATITLANPTGEYTPWTADGQLTYWAPGRRVALFVELDAEEWWLAALRVDAWDVNPDGSVTIEASDGFSLLAGERGPFTVGVAGEKALARIQAVAAFAQFPDPVRGDTGDVTLTRQATDQSPLEEIQRVSLSDGGVVAVDADGAVLYRNRLWPAGRSDQETLDVFTDNVCTVPAVVWDLELTQADEGLATDVRLSNVAGLVATAAITPPHGGPHYPLTHPDPDYWTTQAEGNTLAAVLLAQRSTPKVAIRSFLLHLLDPKQDLWRVGIDRRLGDRIRFIHDYPAPGGVTGTWDLVAVVSTIRHQITPEAWTVEIGTTRTVDYLSIEEWDRTRFVWDDTNPAAVWRY